MSRTSIIVPTHDRAHLISEALDSILSQCASDDEIIVVDDGSTDDTEAVLRRYASRIAVLRQARAGVAAARNAGLAAATGERLAFLDSDDVWDPGHQGCLHGVLDVDPDLTLAFGQVSEFVDGPEGRREIRRAPGAVCGALVARREVIMAVGAFRTDLRVGEFVDWMARARRLGLREVQADAIVLHRRSHAGNMTRGTQEGFSDYLTVLRRHLAARAGPAGP